MTVSGTQSASNGLTFTADGYLLTGGAISLDGSQAANVVSVASGATTTIAGQLVAANGLTKDGVGTLQLLSDLSAAGPVGVAGGTLVFGTNTTYATETSIQGTLRLGVNDAIKAGNDVVLQAGGMLDLDGKNQSLNLLTGSGTAALGSGTLTLGSGGGSGAFAGSFAGTGSVVKVGAGTLTLSGTSTSTGRTILTEGVLGLTAEVNLGANPSSFVADAFTVTNNATILAGGTCTLDDTNRGMYLGAGGATIDSPANTRFTAGVPISGPGGVVKNGERELVLSGSNSFAGGITINAGKVVFSGSNCEDNVPAVLMTGGTLSLSTAFNSGTATIGNLSGAVGSVIDTAYSGSNAIRTLSVAQTVSGTFSGQMIDASNGRTFSLVKAGPATLTLDGFNTYLGATKVTAGTLTFASPSSLYGGNSGLWADRLIVSSGATGGFAVGGVGFSSGEIATLSSLGTGTSGFLDGSSIGLDTSGAGGSFTLTDVIANPNGGANTLGVRKLGDGTLEITAANTYTGVTSVQAGTLALLPGGSIASSTKVAVESGAIFDVTTLGGYVVPSTQTLAGNGTITGNVTIGGGATLSPGASPGTLTFSGDMTWNTAGNYNWQMLSGTGTAGSAWDLISVSGSLSIGATSAGPFNVNLWTLSGISPDVSGSSSNFSSTTSGTWRIATAAGGISGFAADKFRVVTTATNGTDGFANSLGGGTFSIAQSGNNLNLVFTKSSAPTVITINVASGTQTQTQAGYPTLSGSVPMVKTGAGTLVLTAANTLTGSTSVQGGRLQLANGSALGTSKLVPLAGGTVTLSAGLQTTVGGLAANAGGLTDVGNGMVTVAAGLSAEDMVAAIVTGMGDGSWNGTSGITSSVAASSGGDRTVGWLDNGDGSVTFAFAAAGDTNLDWQVDIIDAANFLAGGMFDTGSPASWIEGDFTYDGVVDILDAASFLSNGLFDNGPYNTPAGAAGIAAVPEPAGFALLAMAAFGVAARRFRYAARRRVASPPESPDGD